MIAFFLGLLVAANFATAIWTSYTFSPIDNAPNVVGVLLLVLLVNTAVAFVTAVVVTGQKP